MRKKKTYRFKKKVWLIIDVCRAAVKDEEPHLQPLAGVHSPDDYCINHHMGLIWCSDKKPNLKDWNPSWRAVKVTIEGEISNRYRQHHSFLRQKGKKGEE